MSVEFYVEPTPEMISDNNESYENKDDFPETSSEINIKTSEKILNIKKAFEKLKDLNSSLGKTLEKYSYVNKLCLELIIDSGEVHSELSERKTVISYSETNKIRSNINDDNEAIEKDNFQSRDDFYRCDSRQFLNFKHCAGNSKEDYEVKKTIETKRKNSSTVFSEVFTNCANKDANAGIKIEDLNELEIVTDGTLDNDSILLEEKIKNNITGEFSQYIVDDEVDSNELIMVTIHRKIENFFEKYIPAPIARIFENHFEIIEFVLSIVVCGTYLYYTNLKSMLVNTKKTNKNPSSAKAKLPSIRKFEIEDIPQDRSIPVKVSHSMEPLIILESPSNSSEEINTLTEQYGFPKNITSNHSLKEIFNDDADLKYTNENIVTPEDVLSINDNKKLKIDDVDGNVNTQDGSNSSLDYPLPVNEYFEKIGVLNFEKEPIRLAYVEIVEELQFQFEKKSRASVNWKEVDEIVEEIQEKLSEGDSPTNEFGKAKTMDDTTSSDFPFTDNSFEEMKCNDFIFKSCDLSSEICNSFIEAKQDIESDIFPEKIDEEEKSGNIDKGCLTSPLLDIDFTENILNVEEERLFETSPSNAYLKELSDLDFNFQPMQNTSEHSENSTKLPDFEDERNYCTCENHSLKQKVSETEEQNLNETSIEEGCMWDPQRSHQAIDVYLEDSSESPDKLVDVQEQKNLTNVSPALTNDAKSTIKIDEVIEIMHCTVENTSTVDLQCNNSKLVLNSTPKNIMNVEKNCGDDFYPSQQEDEVCTKSLCIGEFIIEGDLSEGKMVGNNKADHIDCESLEEYQASITRNIHTVEYDGKGENALISEVLRSRQSDILKSSEVAIFEEDWYLKEVKNSSDMSPIEKIETEDSNVLNVQRDKPGVSKNLEPVDEFFNVSLEVNRSFSYMKSLASSEESLEEHSSSDTQIDESSVHFSQMFSSSMPDVREIELDSWLSHDKKNISWKCVRRSESTPNTKQHWNLDSSKQHLLEPSRSRISSRTSEEFGCFKILPMSHDSSSSTEDPPEDFRCFPSFASGPFGIEAATTSKAAIAEFASEVKAVRKKHTKRNSFKSRVSSMFNGVKNKMVNAATEIRKSYNKQKDDDSF